MRVLFILIILLSSDYTFSQKYQQSKFAYAGSIELDGKYDDQKVFDCYYDKHPGSSESGSLILPKSVVKGRSSFPVGTIGNTKEYGAIEYNYYVVLKDKEIGYVITSVKHTSVNPYYPPLGKIPRVYNETVGKVFSEDQYTLIIQEIDAEVKRFLSTVKKEIESCYKEI